MLRITLYIVSVLFVSMLSSFAYAQTSCLVYPSNSIAPSGYGVSWDVFDPAKALLVKSDCPTSGDEIMITVGRGVATQYIWSTTYLYRATGWVAHTLSGTDAGSGWLAGTGTKSVTAAAATATNPLYFVGYVCTNVGSGWKCGCANASCTTRHWQLQAYKGNGGGTTGGTTSATGGTTGGGTSGFVSVAKSKCLTQYPSLYKPFTEGTHTKTSGSGSAFDIHPPANKTTDLRGVKLLSYGQAYQGPTSIVNVGGYTNACIVGGSANGIDDPNDYNWAPNHDWANFNLGISDGAGTFTIENMVFKNAFQDSVTIRGEAPQDLRFSMRGVLIMNNDDDWLQNDNCSSLGIIEDVFVDGTRQGLSMRPGSDSSATCDTFKWTFKNSLVNHVCTKGTDGDGITSASCPNGYKTGQFFKLSGTSMSKVGVDMENVLFRMESMPVSSCKQIEEQLFNNSSTYQNVVIVWDPKDGKAWPGCDMPSGWSVKQGAEGRALWASAKQEWLTKHGCDANGNCTFPNSY